MSDGRALVTGGVSDPLLPRIEEAARGAAGIDIVVAFAKRSGVEALEPLLRDALRRGARVRVLTGDYLTLTDADALDALWMIGEPPEEVDDPVAGDGRRDRTLELRVIEVARLAAPTNSFHPKAWIFVHDGARGHAFVGSSNLSRAALETAIEWNLHVTEHDQPRQFREITRAFEQLWSEASTVDLRWISEYRRRPRPLATVLEAPADEPIEPLPEPHAAQQEALATLSRIRLEGGARALVVLATGLGKTLLAAFDYAALRAAAGRPLRLLFIAHRRELLAQARGAYLRLCASRGWTETLGWCIGSYDELDRDLVFGSVSKLSRDATLDRLRGEAFDYVVIDEVHHAAAASYRKILEAVRTRFVLGLTATPDRADRRSILSLFGDRVAYRANIARGILLGRLVTFAYFGLKDTIDYQKIPWRNGALSIDALAREAAHAERMNDLWRAWTERPTARTLVFCCTQQHALFVRDWLRSRGVRVNAVFSGSGSDDREESLRRIASDREGLDALCVVDLFNEGLDVPSIDRVVMLRPTESPVVFLQQLGRGLRAHENKSRLVVIDFVGNHGIFADRLRALFAAASAEDPEALVRQAARTRGPIDVHGCSVSLEVEAKDVLRDLLRAERAQTPEAPAPPEALAHADRVIDLLWVRPEAERSVTHPDNRRARLAARSNGLMLALEHRRAFVSRNAIAWAVSLVGEDPGTTAERVVTAQFPGLHEHDDPDAPLPSDRVELAEWALALVRQAGPLRRAIGKGLRVRDEEGREMDATFSIEADESGVYVVFDARGDNRNTEYAPALERLLARIARERLRLREVSVASRDARAARGKESPLDLAPSVLAIEVPEQTRKAIGRAAARSGRAPEAKGSGNNSKRLRLTLDFNHRPLADDELIVALRGPRR
jgi:superfamily II DNA or RNA helicase/HKD family nuclease